MNETPTNSSAHEGPALLKRSRRVLDKLEKTLQKTYGASETHLGNKRNPLNEAIYIILSYQTTVRRSKLTWGRLRSSFRQWHEVERASTGRVARTLLEGGLQHQKAREIKALLRAVRRIFGKLSLNSLRKESDKQAEQILTKLPGLSWKGARCVMLYALRRAVLPIDVNTFRIFKRVGIIHANAVYRRKILHDALQSAVRPSRRRRFHINLVIHGQRTCLPVNPKCGICPIRGSCLKIGLTSTKQSSFKPVTRKLFNALRIHSNANQKHS
jgi:endonuclease-3